MNENKPRRRAQAQAAQKATRKSGLSRFVLMVAMMALVAVVSIGGTMAWLRDNTEEVVNTFTSSDVDIEIAETTGEKYQMIPGDTIKKDPKVTVKADSEACWLFVKLTKENSFDNFMTYTMADDWTVLDGVDGVYYREVADTDADQVFGVILNDQVTVKTDVTKAMMDALVSDNPETSETNESNEPKLTVQAYAVQMKKDNTNDFTAAEAWALVSGS